MAWPWEIVERDHVLQNPTSAEKIRLLGEYLRLDAGSRVLDLASGRCGPAIVPTDQQSSVSRACTGARSRSGSPSKRAIPTPARSAPDTTQRREYVGVQRAQLGWAIVVGRKS